MPKTERGRAILVGGLGFAILWAMFVFAARGDGWSPVGALLLAAGVTTATFGGAAAFVGLLNWVTKGR